MQFFPAPGFGNFFLPGFGKKYYCRFTATFFTADFRHVFLQQFSDMFRLISRKRLGPASHTPSKHIGLKRFSL